MSGETTTSERERSSPRFGILVVVVVALALAIWMLMPSVGSRPASYKAQCNNNLKQLGVAFHNYHAQQRCLPPAFVADANGRPLLSWRGAILPYLEQGIAGYILDPGHADEPWNSPGNRLAARTVVPSLLCPEGHGATEIEYPRTDYVAVVGEGTAWPGARPMLLEDITDGPANTILLVEVADSDIAILEPRDLRFDIVPMRINPPDARGISSGHKGGANVLMADGSVHFLTNETPPDVLRAMLTANGGEKITPPWAN